MNLLYPATAGMLKAARLTGGLNPAASMHSQRFVVLHVALAYADREDDGLDPVPSGAYMRIGGVRQWNPETRALILTVRVAEDSLLPVQEQWRCRYSARPIPVRAITDITDVTDLRGTPDHRHASREIVSALRKERTR